ncbi:unnamed protein product [Prorocentrum cordatum]|uniref:Defective in cullin neddylation protein n=1 Tax=Prorocentrum cordatum TaxID=2364126 RepID=A0ABN9VJR1_9DINO|nr:unnamed protein product [Polarella glacialis]
MAQVGTSHCCRTDVGKDEESYKHILTALAENTKVLDQLPPVVLTLVGEATADRKTWQQSLTELGKVKFTATPERVSRFSEVVEQSRAAAKADVLDGQVRGLPDFATFADQLKRLASDTVPGPDEFLGKSWIYAPHWMTRCIYVLFCRRWMNIEWGESEVATWKEFVLRGFKTVSQPTSFKQYRWLGLIDHLFKLYSATNHAVVARCVRKPQRANSYG